MAAALFALVVGAPFAAGADGPRRDRKGEGSYSGKGEGSHSGKGEGSHSEGKGERSHSVPEFDPASVGVIAAIVAGGGYLIARRRKS